MNNVTEPIGIRNRKAALSNIRLKIELLAQWAVSGPPINVEGSEGWAHVLPKSLRQFNAWEHEDLPVNLRAPTPRFTSNANETVRKAGLAAEINEVLHALAERLRPPRTKMEKQTELRRRLADSERRRKIAEFAVLDARREAMDLRSEVRMWQRRMELTKSQSDQVLEEKEALMAALNRELADVRKMLRTITPLRSRQ